MISKGPAGNLEALKDAASHLGLDMISSAVIDDELRETFHSALGEAADLGYAVSIAIRLSAPVLETVVKAPTWTYYHHYRTVNFALDQAALFIAGECQRMGARALPIPASQILDWDRLKGHLSHREVAFRAGIGWQGRNNLLVTGPYGAQVRLVTVLTDLPLPDCSWKDEPGCGSCTACLSVCPVGAIKQDPSDFDLDKCSAQLRRFSKEEKLNTLICGLCVRACPGKGGPDRSE